MYNCLVPLNASHDILHLLITRMWAGYSCPYILGRTGKKIQVVLIKSSSWEAGEFTCLLNNLNLDDCLKLSIRIRGVAAHIKMLATVSEDLSSISGRHVIKRENWFPQLVLWSLHTCTHTPKHMLTDREIENREVSDEGRQTDIKEFKAPISQNELVWHQILC